jgi:hypothetical protein
VPLEVILAQDVDREVVCTPVVDWIADGARSDEFCLRGGGAGGGCRWGAGSGSGVRWEQWWCWCLGLVEERWRRRGGLGGRGTEGIVVLGDGRMNSVKIRRCLVVESSGDQSGYECKYQRR